jgi:hypothetical protein
MANQVNTDLAKNNLFVQPVSKPTAPQLELTAEAKTEIEQLRKELDERKAQNPDPAHHRGDEVMKAMKEKHGLR